MINTIAFTSIKPISFTAKNKKEHTQKTNIASSTKTYALAGLMALSNVGAAQVTVSNNNNTNAVNTEIKTQKSKITEEKERLNIFLTNKCNGNYNEEIISFVVANKKEFLNILKLNNDIKVLLKSKKLLNKYIKENPELHNKTKVSDNPFYIFSLSAEIKTFMDENKGTIIDILNSDNDNSIHIKIDKLIDKLKNDHQKLYKHMKLVFNLTSKYDSDNDLLKTIQIKSFIENNKEAIVDIINTENVIEKDQKRNKLFKTFKAENQDIFD